MVGMSRLFRSKRYWWIERREYVIFLFIIALLILISPQKERQGSVTAFPSISFGSLEHLPIPTPAPYPVNIAQTPPPSEITAHAVYIVDDGSGVSLYAKNETIPLPPASTTKLMTAMVALDVYDPLDIVSVKPSTAGGQLMRLILNERITVENLLYGILIQSGNDAAEQLAFHHPEGYHGFVRVMNEKARSIYLEHSLFTNVVGWDESTHRMSAKDLARLARVALTYPLIKKMVSIPEITVSDVDYTVFHKLKTTNQLLGKVPGVSGIKTGFTQEAGQNLVTLVERDGRRVIIVVMRSQDRFADTTALIDWVFKNFQWVSYGI